MSNWSDSTGTANINWSSTNDTSGGTLRINPTYSVQSPQSAGCNESKKHDNDEKALFHGLKSAYRMSREYDGSEYGAVNPQREAAARIAANAAIAYLRATGQEYTREDSWEYIEENYARSVGWAEKFFGGEKTVSDRIGDVEFENAIDQAWTQTDSKEKHYDGARTALAAAEAYLDETFDAAPLPLREREVDWDV